MPADYAGIFIFSTAVTGSSRAILAGELCLWKLCWGTEPYKISTVHIAIALVHSLCVSCRESPMH